MDATLLANVLPSVISGAGVAMDAISKIIEMLKKRNINPMYEEYRALNKGIHMGWHIGILLVLYQNENAEKVDKERGESMVGHSLQTLKMLVKEDGLDMDLSRGLGFCVDTLSDYYKAEDQIKSNGIILGVVGYMAYLYFWAKKKNGGEEALLEALNEYLLSLSFGTIDKNDKLLSVLEKHHPYDSVQYSDIICKELLT